MCDVTTVVDNSNGTEIPVVNFDGENDDANFPGSDERLNVWEPLTVLVALHPSYFNVFKQTIVSMFYGDGPLPVHHRHYLAIMAACRHQCQFLVDLHKTEFVRYGGDENWLTGRHEGAQKLRDFDVLNKILAHQPWLIQSSHLQALLDVSSPNNWSLSELVHGAVILSHVHAFCSFVHGCGVASHHVTKDKALTNGVAAPHGGVKSATHQNGSMTHHQRKSHDGEGDASDNNVEKLMAYMLELSEKHVTSSQEDKIQQFMDINVQSSEITPDDDQQGAPNACFKSAFSAFTESLPFCYVDFVKRSDPTASHTFKIHDYSWEDQGYGVINQYCGQLCNVVDDKFKLIENLTYRTMGEHKNVDTTKYRMAVWNYIQSLYGIRHDDYDYAEVNRLLSRQYKIFVKTVGCYPERTTEALRASVMVDFQHSEKIHVNLLIFESRFQAELLYLLRALTRIMV